MPSFRPVLALPLVALALLAPSRAPAQAPSTTVSIRGDAFYINDRPTYEGRTWRGLPIEGRLLNARMVQATFDDLNPDTRARWAYPDTGLWDPDRNTREFLAQMPAWRRAGLLAVTVNFQGGSPQGYSKDQPWHNSAFTEDGDLRPDYAARMERVVRRADELGLVVILGFFYFGQDQRLRDEQAVLRAVDVATDWITSRDFRNVLVEINNECNIKYDHPILQAARVHELIERVRARSKYPRPLLVGASFGGGTVPTANVIAASDFLLIHGNGVRKPARMTSLVRDTRAAAGDRVLPIVVNEDDHFDFDQPENNFTAALAERASWGYFDYRKADESFSHGYQSVPVDWSTSSPRKRGFFRLLAEITGGEPPP